MEILLFLFEYNIYWNPSKVVKLPDLVFQEIFVLTFNQFGLIGEKSERRCPGV